jgi:predicted DNA-binding protein
VGEIKGRAPGGGRKPVDPDGSEMVVLRVDRALRRKLGALAEKHGRSRSHEIRVAINSHLRRAEIRSLYTEALARAVAVLADRIEEATGKQWLNDPLTSQLVREYADQLIAHLIPAPAEPVSVPAEIRETANLVLTLLKIAVRRPGSPSLGAVGVIIDDPDLAATVSDLARDIGGAKRSDEFPNVRTLPELVARRDRQRRKK